jgi:hypothetical protein
VHVGGGSAVSTNPDGQAAKGAVRSLTIPDHAKGEFTMLVKILLSVVFVVVSSSTFAQSGTPEEQAACRPDVRRFCHAIKEQDGDQAFLGCLELHRDRLSEACRNVLKDHGR